MEENDVLGFTFGMVVEGAQFEYDNADCQDQAAKRYSMYKTNRGLVNNLNIVWIVCIFIY